MSGDRPRLKKAVAAGELILTLLHRHGLEAKIEECRAWVAWDEVVGPQIAAHARPVRVREGVLEVRVDQPVWMQQLQLLKPRILAKLNGRLGRPVLRDIFWRRGRVDRAAPDREEEAIAWRAVALSAADEELIRETLAAVADTELRDGLREVLTRQLRLEKARGQRQR
jgi:predicted nucleic acid-binding Zn ribbon protein